MYNTSPTRCDVSGDGCIEITFLKYWLQFCGYNWTLGQTGL